MSKLRVSHYAQLPCTPFIVPVQSKEEAYKLITILAQQHLFLEGNKIIPDYCNSFTVESFNEETQEWEEYYDEDGNDWTEIANELEKEFSDFDQEIIALNKA